MTVDLYLDISNFSNAEMYFLYVPTTNACTAFSPEYSNLDYIYMCLFKCSYTYFEPNVDGNYLTTLDINSIEDFYRYPEFFI